MKQPTNVTRPDTATGTKARSSKADATSYKNAMMAANKRPSKMHLARKNTQLQTNKPTTKDKRPLPEFHQRSTQHRAPPQKAPPTISKQEAIRALRQPPPSRPAFTNDGRHLNLENHDILFKIIKHNFKQGEELP